MRNREHEVEAAGTHASGGGQPTPNPTPTPAPIRVENPPIDEEEMGGEAPCQLHRFWDVDE